MGYMVGHWSHYSECFAAFPHGRVETQGIAMVACGVAREDIPMFEGGGDVGPVRVAPAAAAEALSSILDVVRDEAAAAHTRQGSAAHAWAAAASEPDHSRRFGLVVEAMRHDPPRRWSATESLAAAVRAVTACPVGA